MFVLKHAQKTILEKDRNRKLDSESLERRAGFFDAVLASNLLAYSKGSALLKPYAAINVDSKRCCCLVSEEIYSSLRFFYLLR